jgi:N-acyl-D-aspartate/D-glutamate deacylase
VSYDLVIRNGSVVDGSGLGSYHADIGVLDGRIATIGRIRERGAVDVDAEGHAVTPGFIDGHTHLDAQVFWDPLGANSCWHGVTTVVMGNCGFTLAPASSEDRLLVIRSLERAEDMSRDAMEAGIDWSWTTFAEYLDAVDRLPKGINYAAQIGHSALRTFAMGERAFEEEATDVDLEVMATELRAALRAGASGFTTSRTQHHQTSDDRPVASRLASWDEVRHLVGVLGDLGAGTFQFVEDAPPPELRPARYAEIIELAAETGVPFAVGATSGADRILPFLDDAAAAGARVFGLSHCRGIGTMSSLRTQLPFDRLPEWRDLRALPLEEQRRRLADPDLVARLARIALDGPYPNAYGGEARPPDFDRMQVLEQPVPPNPTVAEAAAKRGVDPVTFIIERSLQSDVDVFFVQTNTPFDHADVKRILEHQHTVMAFSDSGAHVSQMSDASIQTHLLAHWVRDRQDFTFEAAIRMLTLAPARAWGFHDRGLVREGLVADLNVLDPATVGPAMPTVVHDLPAGGKRIEQKATGLLATVVGGQLVHHAGQHVGALPGRLLRGPLARRAR